MATNIDINPRLLQNALKLGGFPTKKETINTLLQEYIARKERQKILGYFGKIDFVKSYDYKKERNR
jgi:Arc/MetJ family transcription regulator